MKKTLLIAAAALVAGVISSEAQVYSVNIVGYVNVVVPQAPAYVCAANPFDLDGVDNITNVLAGIPNSTTIQTWTTGGFVAITKNAAGHWTGPVATTFIPPGVGFLIKGQQSFTNTFVGSVVIPSGGTNNYALPLGLSLIGSPVPYGGTLTNGADTGPATLNLGASLPINSGIQTWNNGFSLAAKRQATGKWTANPTFTVGQGFFVSPGAATNWQQTLN